MEKKPLVSIIIPTLNEAPIIGGLLEELKNLSQVEIIVSDGGSTDDTLEICALFPVQLCTGASGRGAQLNRGAQAAGADILLFLHADCHIPAELIQQLIDAVSHGKLWGCAQISFDDSACFFKWTAFISNLRARLLSSCYGDQAIFCQKEFFYKTGQFSEIIFLEDLVFSRWARRQQKAFVVPVKVISSSRRFHAGGPWRTAMKMQIVKFLYFMGVEPARLSRIYRYKLGGNNGRGNNYHEQGTSSRTYKNTLDA